MQEITHYLFFDGTSFFIGDHHMREDDIDLEVIKESDDLDMLQDFADYYNSEL